MTSQWPAQHCLYIWVGYVKLQYNAAIKIIFSISFSSQLYAEMNAYQSLYRRFVLGWAHSREDIWIGRKVSRGRYAV